MNRKNRRRRVFANKIHREIFLAIFLPVFLTAAIVSVAIYYLIFGITAEQVAIPEAIAYNLIPASEKVTVILLFSALPIILAILIFAYKVSHKIVGPFDRIVRELDERIKGENRNHITVRKGDKFKPLVDNINKLLDKI